MRVVWAIMPVILTCLCILTWAVINKVSPVADLIVKIKISCVALLYLIWPSLCTNTFALFACRSVCGESYMQIDINVRCFSGQHAGFAGALGVPMLLLYVCGLPVGAMFALKRMVYAKHIAVANNELNGDAAGKLMEQFRIWGSFSAFYADETWFWEATVVVRKILIALIGVFGSRMEGMQVHLTSMVIVASLIATAFTHPYRGHYRGLLQALEMICLGGIWLTLWAAAVFSEYPKCEVLGAGNRTHVWCDTIAVVVGVVDVVIVLSCVVFFLAVKRWQSNASKSARVEDGGEIRGPGNNVQSGVEQHDHVELELAPLGGGPRTAADRQWQNNPCFT